MWCGKHIQEELGEEVEAEGGVVLQESGAPNLGFGNMTGGYMTGGAAGDWGEFEGTRTSNDTWVAVDNMQASRPCKLPYLCHAANSSVQYEFAPDHCDERMSPSSQTRALS